MTLSQPEEKLLVIFKDELKSAAAKLKESLDRTAQLDLDNIEGVQLDLIEALTARFGRTSDILIR
jgi:hypothetical protein